MDRFAALRYSRIALTVLITAALWGCGQGEDKSKTEKKVESPPPPKAAPAPPKKKEEPKPEPKATTDLPGGWKLLGQRQADHKSDRDRIDVGREKGNFKELQVTVQGAPLVIDEVIITFGNDRQFKPQLQKEFSIGSSAVIDMPGKDNNVRAVKHVDFVYRTAQRGQGKSTVLLYGR